MTKKKYASISDNVTIDLFDYIWNVVSQWKAILIFALIVSVMAMFLQYHSDMKVYNNSEKQTMTVDSLREELNSEQLIGVEFAVRQQLLLEKYQNYMDQSPLLSIDPSQEHVLKTTYVISGCDATTTASLVDAYNALFLSSSFVDGVGELMPESENKDYASALIVPGAIAVTPTDEKETTQGSGVIGVSIILLDQMSAEEVQNFVDKSVTDYTAKLTNSIGVHQLSLVSSDETTLVNIELAGNQQDIINYSYIIRNSVQQLTQNFTEQQKNLYDLMLKEAHQSDDAEEASITITPEHPRLSKRSLVLGFIVGVLLYAFAYLVLVLFQKTIKTAKECEDTMSIRTLGELHEFHGRGWKKLFNSKLFYGLKYRKYRDINLQTNKIVDSMVAYAKKHPGCKIQFVSVAPVTEQEEKYLREMIHDAKNQGVEVSLLVGDVNRDTTFHQNLAQADQMILVLCSGRSRYEDIDLCMNLATESDLDTIGTVFVDC
ncbi:hypothetical protein SAMN02910301_0346 [Lachnospiraceae bacterium XBD2001]|nr:hypothetical protein SAMN02910301_0346 [Lachnospiraceae bacterium XBD2001]